MLGPTESIKVLGEFFGELFEASGAVQLVANHQEGGSADANRSSGISGAVPFPVHPGVRLHPG
jgi:hypothetical protein